MSKSAVLALAALLSAAIFAGAAFADQSHTVVTLAPGAHSDPITVPGPYLPVALVCADTGTNAAPGLGNASLVRNGSLIWTSYSFVSQSIATGSNGATPVLNIVACDATGSIFIQSVNGTQIRVVNSSPHTGTIDVMFIF